jgi:hypothetical protein
MREGTPSCRVPVAVHGRTAHGDPAVANEHYVVMTVECPRCKTKQKVHVSTSLGGAQVGNQIIPCLICNGLFKVTVPGRIILGPFPAWLGESRSAILAEAQQATF